ncbi:MAG TPA: DUF1549 domain-containing protein, partial [Planctomycetaceae bacterium]|nr:DUF1549 domain-containing protein [Planctomycetaceae bacterium]
MSFQPPRLLPGLLLILSLHVAAADDELRLLPRTLELTGRDTSHRLLAERFSGDDAVGSADVELTTDNPGVVRIDGMTIQSVADGQATVRIAGSNSETTAVTVTVSGTQQPFHWSFRNHVEPVLAKQGCNSGACHGALAGKGGFKLSLHGYDPERDYFNLVELQRGRRVEPAEPAASLMLTKPTMAVPHKGGLRLKTDSWQYKIVSEWIAQGVARPSENDVRLARLEILPELVNLKTASSQPLLVRAHYSDGRIEDVTQLAKFTSSNEAVATVATDGLTTVVGPGEGAVTAWFSSQIVIARIVVPWEHALDETVFASAARRNFIDDTVLAQLQRLNLKPSPRCSDEVFIRRVFLDTIGTLPTSTEVREFLADESADKRDRVIESLLRRPEFIDFWTYRWSDVLLLNGTTVNPVAINAFYKWIHERVEQDVPWDQFVREIVASRGSNIEHGATNFYAIHQLPEDMAETVSQAFLGLSIGCAKCHNHPLEKWTNDQYYAFANLFSRVRAKGWGGDARSGDGIRTLVTVSSGELVQPKTGKPQPPTPLDAEPLAFDAPGDRREYAAAWLTSPENKLFARSITNRIWKNFFGVGLVEQVDDMRTSNPASNEEMLAAASDYLVQQKFDLKALMRAILQSETYQRSSETLSENAGDQRQYSRYFPRRMMAEVLLDAVSQVTDVPTNFNKIVFLGSDVKDTKDYPKGTRAIQLHDSAVQSYFLQTFGRNQRRITCECERSDEPSLIQVLNISNGDTINGKLAAADNRLTRWLTEASSDEELLNEVFLTCVARVPSEAETAEILSLLGSAKPEDRRELLEDLVWSILSSR